MSKNRGKKEVYSFEKKSKGRGVDFFLIRKNFEKTKGRGVEIDIFFASNYRGRGSVVSYK